MIITCIRKRFHVFLHATITLYPLEKKHPLLCKIIYHTSSSPHIPNIRAFLPFQGKNSVPPYSFIPGRNTIAPRYPNTSAPLIPTALAVNPPSKIPSTPSSLIAFTTPFHSVFPNPKSGTVAPAPPTLQTDHKRQGIPEHSR